MSQIHQIMRSAAHYRPGKTPVEYEKIALHHIASMPTFEKHTRRIRSWDPKLRKIVVREVEKVIMSLDGKTPLRPIFVLEKDPKTGEQRHVNQMELVPVQAPIRLKVGSPKWQYRQLKKLERRAGLVNIYREMQAAADKVSA